MQLHFIYYYSFIDDRKFVTIWNVCHQVEEGFCSIFTKLKKIRISNSAT